jgi:hypothetical protein
MPVVGSGTARAGSSGAAANRTSTASAALPDFIAVTFDGQVAGIPGQALINDEPMTAGEDKLARQLSVQAAGRAPGSPS